MNMLVESLKRLYLKGEISSTKLNDMLIKKTITKEEYQYIISN